jgi:DNA-binding PadR family transcriptional regulator
MGTGQRKGLPRPKRDKSGLLPIHYQLLEFFHEPRALSGYELQDAFAADGSFLNMRLRDLEAEGLMEITRPKNRQAAPNHYALTEAGRKAIGKKNLFKIVVDLSRDERNALLPLVEDLFLSACADMMGGGSPIVQQWAWRRDALHALLKSLEWER